MRKFNLTILFLLALLPVLFAGQTTRIPYRGIYADDPNGTAGIYNPERGFRLEIAVDIAKKCDVWKPQEYPGITDYLESEINKYACDSVSLVQTYFYLHGYIGRQLPPEAFATMDVYFNKLRQLGKKALLRFAYETEPMGTVSSGPTMEDMFRHMKQLKPYLEKNKDVILALQAGFIGAWGEWHSSKHNIESSDANKRIILEKICRMTPQDRVVQVRVPDYKNLLPKDSEAYRKTSFHDDFIVVDPHRWDGNMHEGTPNFDQIVEEGAFMPVDGELPWGTWSMNKENGDANGWIIDGKKTARQLFLEHYTSLSVIHNYKERGAPDKYSMMYWKETPISEEYLKEKHMPVSDGYFRKHDGSAAQRNAFEYVRDHLGYRLELQELQIDTLKHTDNHILNLSLTLINRGFSTLFNEHPVYFVLVDEHNQVKEFLTNADTNSFQPYRPGDKTYTPLIHTIKGQVTLPKTANGTYKLGLWIPDGSRQLQHLSRFAIRCANGDIPWWISPDRRYGINILTTLQVPVSSAISFSSATASPKLPYQRADLPIEERVKDLLQRMTPEEKLAQIRHIHSWEIFNGQALDERKLEEKAQGMSWGFVEGFPLTAENCAKNMLAIQRFMVEKTRLGIPIFTVAESLHGVVHEGATVFPQNIALGSTFDTDLAYRKTSMIADELHAVGMRQVLSPCIDVVRDLRWGRVEESFGEDPYLCGRFGIAEVKGYMDNGISPMLKHYGPHGNPLSGLNLASVETSIRDLHEVYLKPFEMVMKQAPTLAVMSAYNSWNRIPNSASHYLLTDVLRKEWGFKGYVYSDWGAIEMLKNFHFTARNSEEAALQALTAGLDVEASSDCYPAIPGLIERGELNREIVDEAVRRVLYAKFRIGLFDDPYGEKFAKGAIHSGKAIALSKKIADESTVLLKNERQLLPLSIGKLKSIAVIGPNADQIQFGDYTWTRDNRFGVTPLQGIRKWAGTNVKVNYAKGCSLVSMDESGIRQAVEAAEQSDVCVLFCGSASAALARDYKSSTCGEGFDLNDLTLTGAQPALIKAVQATGKPVILVLVTGKPFAIPWEKKNIPAILVQWYAGEQSGNSIADILFGKVSPSGRLTFSFPESTGHLPVYYNHLRSDRGFYKSPGSYDSPGRDYVFSAPVPLWSFGHGLTYTTFEYSNLQTDRASYLLNDTVHVRIDLKNTGKCEGKEVVQLYVSDVCSSVAMPIRQLRDFRKVALQAGETQIVRLSIPVSELSILNEKNEAIVEPGEFEIQVGSASDHILLRKTIRVGQPQPVVNRQEQVLPKSERQITVQGVIRDVQATLIPEVRIYEKTTGKLLGKSDNRGNFTVKTGNREILRFQKKGYQSLERFVDNQENINIRMDYGTD